MAHILLMRGRWRMASKYADDGDVWRSADGSDGVWGGINGLCVGGYFVVLRRAGDNLVLWLMVCVGGLVVPLFLLV